MTDDLTERLRDNTRTYQDKITDRLDAADRIEELEGAIDWQIGRAEAAEVKLAKAMGHVADYSNDPHLVGWARRNLAELTGGKDD